MTQPTKDTAAAGNAAALRDPEGYVWMELFEVMDGDQENAEYVLGELAKRGVMLAPTAVIELGHQSAQVAMLLLDVMGLRVTELEDRFARIADAHVKNIGRADESNGLCGECMLEWPCPTYAWSDKDSARRPIDGWNPDDDEMED